MLGKFNIGDVGTSYSNPWLDMIVAPTPTEGVSETNGSSSVHPGSVSFNQFCQDFCPPGLTYAEQVQAHSDVIGEHMAFLADLQNITPEELHRRTS